MSISLPGPYTDLTLLVSDTSGSIDSLQRFLGFCSDLEIVDITFVAPLVTMANSVRKVIIVVLTLTVTVTVD